MFGTRFWSRSRSWSLNRARFASSTGDPNMKHVITGLVTAAIAIGAVALLNRVAIGRKILGS